MVSSRDAVFMNILHSADFWIIYHISQNSGIMMGEIELLYYVTEHKCFPLFSFMP